jgi:hypothetical protein
MADRATEVYDFCDRHELWPLSFAQRRLELLRMQAATRQAQAVLRAAERGETKARDDYRRQVAAAVVAGVAVTADAAILRRAADAHTDAIALLDALYATAPAIGRAYTEAFGSLAWAAILRAVRATDDPAAEGVATVIVWHLEQNAWPAGEPRYAAAW